MTGLFLVDAAQAAERATLTFSCVPGNDLYRVYAAAAGRAAPRFDSAREAVDHAAAGSGVLILAEGYPDKTTTLDESVFKAAERKQLRLYVEYPSMLPNAQVGPPRGTSAERAVVASDFFGPGLGKPQILAINGLHFVSIAANNPHLVAAKVAGFDTAVFGLPPTNNPILFEHSHGNLLVATTKLSHFVTGRYAPQESWRAVWTSILGWLTPGQVVPELKWTPVVRPTYGRNEPLPRKVERQALQRGVEWFVNSKLLLHPSRVEEVDRANKTANGLALTPSPDAPVGNGTLGILEAPLSIILPDGNQMQSCARRGDCTGESAMALAFGGKLFHDRQGTTIARNLLDFWCFTSDARKKERGDPKNGAYGLVAWGIDSPAWYVANYGDDNARFMLGTMATAALTGDDRWDEAVMMCLLANLRTTGRLGFRDDRIDIPALSDQGWRPFFARRIVSYSPHMEAYLWACYLWAYERTGFELFYQLAETAIRMTMVQYTDGWRWTNGLAQEKARILLPLAWLVRVKDTPEHRAWLQRAVDGLLALQEPCGAIREELGLRGKGMFPPPESNEAYGGGEASLIQQNGDPVTDLLYTANFAFLGLHEAASATGDPRIREAEEKLAKFLCRIQIRSEARPALDGGWFRAFDYRRWEHWASNADAGWGAWAIESGWTQGWITSVLAMRQMKTSLWDLTKRSKIQRHFGRLHTEMLPADATQDLPSLQIRHAAQGKPYRLDVPPSAHYPDEGGVSLTDGELAPTDHADPAWLGLEGPDIVTTLDLGESTPIRELAAEFLESIRVGIYLPTRLELQVSENGQDFTTLRTVERPPAKDKAAWVHRFAVEGLNTRARYVRFHAKNPGPIAQGKPGAGANSWLFVSEVMVNPTNAPVQARSTPASAAGPLRAVSLTVIPPAPVTEQINLEVRAGVWNRRPRARSFNVEFYLDAERQSQLLHRASVKIPAQSNQGIQFRWPAKGAVGRHRILVVTRSGREVSRESQAIEIIASSARSTARIAGAWAGLYHWSEQEGRLWNTDIKNMTDDDWRDLVRGMHQIGLTMLVGGESFRNQAYVGEHAIEKEGYAGRAFYPSHLYPRRMRVAANDPFEAILSEADQLGMHVFMPVGNYAWFDFTAGSLAWHKEVAEELWTRYGHHRSFYGWYVTGEIAGNLGTTDERRREIVEFFKEFRAHTRRLAPDKPVMLATNCHKVPEGLPFYPDLLRSLDILCPFGFHRMPAGDITGEAAAATLQRVCDEAGAHLWMDLEVFLFTQDGALYPRDIEGLASDLRRFPNFETILCYQYPGLMTAPGAARKLGGDAAVKLFLDYQDYLVKAKSPTSR